MKNIETTTTSNEKTVSPPAAISVILRSAPWSPFKMWMFQLLMAVVAENPRKPTVHPIMISAMSGFFF